MCLGPERRLHLVCWRLSLRSIIIFNWLIIIAAQDYYWSRICKRVYKMPFTKDLGDESNSRRYILCIETSCVYSTISLLFPFSNYPEDNYWISPPPPLILRLLEGNYGKNLVRLCIHLVTCKNIFVWLYHYKEKMYFLWELQGLNNKSVQVFIGSCIRIILFLHCSLHLRMHTWYVGVKTSPYSKNFKNIRGDYSAL